MGRRARIWLGVTWWRWRQQEGGRERERGEGGETARAQSVTVGVAFSLVRWPRAGSWWGRRGSGRVGRVRGAPPCSCGRPCGVYVLFSRELIFKLSFSLSLSLSLSLLVSSSGEWLCCVLESKLTFFSHPFYGVAFGFGIGFLGPLGCPHVEHARENGHLPGELLQSATPISSSLRVYGPRGPGAACHLQSLGARGHIRQSGWSCTFWAF
jgi:hypothetical protein